MADQERAPGHSGPVERIAGDAQRLSGDVVSAGQQAVLGVVEQHKAAVAEQVAGVADALDATADAVGRAVPGAAEYVHEAGQAARGAAEALRRQGVSELFDRATAFARTQPAAFAGVSVLAGLAIARFLKSSAERRSHAGHPAGPEPRRRASTDRPRTI